MDKLILDGEKLFSLFTEKLVKTRPVLCAPYEHAGYVYASNGNIMLRVSRELVKGEYATDGNFVLPIPQWKCERIVTLTALEKALSLVPQIDETESCGKYAECEECEGTGKVEAEYIDRSFTHHYFEEECPTCNGTGHSEEALERKTGRKIPVPYAAFKIGHYSFFAGNVKKLHDAMLLLGKDSIKLVNEENDTYAHFNVQEGVDILVCRCTKDADVEVEIEDTTASNI